MNTIKEMKLMLLTNRKEEEMISRLFFDSETYIEKAQNASDCLVKLQISKYDVLIVDSNNLMTAGRVNRAYIRAINELVPVIVISDGKNLEIEDAIRTERIFYCHVGPVCDNEIKEAVMHAAKWNMLQKQRENAGYELKLYPDASKILKICAMLLLFCSVCAVAQDITVSVTPFRNSTGNSCNDWIGAGFASSLITSINNIPGVKVIEDSEMSKLLESIKFGLSGFVDEKTAVEKGKVIGIKYSVVGNVQLFDDKAVICYRLVNMETGEVVFSNISKGKLKNILGIEEEVNREIVKHFEEKFPSICLKFGAKKRSTFAMLHGDGSQGLKYSLMEDREEAIKCLEAAILENAQFADGYLALGDIYMQKMEYDNALGRYCRAYGIYSEYHDVYFAGYAAYKMGEVYYQQSDYESAVAYFNKAIACKSGCKVDSQLTNIYCRLFDICAMRQENAKAEDYLNKALKVSKKQNDVNAQLEILSKLAKYFGSINDLTSALKYSQKAYELSMKSANPEKNELGGLVTPAGIEKEYIAKALAQTNGNVEKAASLLKMNGSAFSAKIKEYGLLNTGTSPEAKKENIAMNLENSAPVCEMEETSKSNEALGENNTDSAIDKEQVFQIQSKLQKRISVVQERSERIGQRSANLKLNNFSGMKTVGEIRKELPLKSSSKLQKRILAVQERAQRVKEISLN